MFIFIVAALVIILDQASKAAIRDSLSLNQSIPVINKIFSLTYIKNQGAAFGMLPGLKPLFVTVAFLVAAAVLYLYFSGQAKDVYSQIALGLVLGGAGGNLIDRVLYGRVTDFLDFHFFPVFNLADTAISIGIVLICIKYIQEERNAVTDETGTD